MSSELMEAAEKEEAMPRLVPAAGDEEVPLRILVEQSVAGIYIVQDELIVYSNDAYAAIHGYRSEEIIGKHISMISSPAGVQEIIDNIRRRISGEEATIHYIAKGQHRNGHVVYTETHGSRFMFRGRPAISGIIVDVTERVLKEKALDRSRERFRRLARRLVDIREQQRMELARELHDVVGGMLTTLKMRLTNASRWETNIEKIYEIDEIVDVTEQCIAAIRDLTRKVRTPTLDSLGFAHAVDEALQDFKLASAIDFVFRQQGTLPVLPAIEATHVFRIFQETLTNIARHSGAGMVDVTLVVTESDWSLEVSDDGVGIPENILNESTEAHGILGMHERADRIGAELSITRRAPQGTRVRITTPLTCHPQPEYS